jgi:heme-degrading monooxygenase HmoA
MSVLEVARLTVNDGAAEAFEADFAKAHAYVVAAEGQIESSLTRVAGSENNYVFLVEWEHLEDHTERFAGSAAFGAFDALIGPHLAGAPSVEHFEKI